MSKVIIFQGSPRKKGTTAALLEAVAEGAKSKGAEVLEYDLNNKELRGCQGCRSCRREDAEACVQNDYFKPMYKELKEADGVVLGAPIYMGSITAQAWILINRLYPAMGTNFQPRFPGKNFVLAITQGNSNAEAFKPAMDTVSAFMQRLGWEFVGELLWASAGGEVPAELKQAAFEAGEKLVK